MKKLILGLSLFAVACSPDKPAPVTTPAATAVANEKRHVTDQATQKYNLHDMNVAFTRVTIAGEASESKDLFLLRTPTEVITFMVDKKTGTLEENLSADLIALVQRSENANAPDIDLGVQTLINYYAVENVLNVDRCRSLPVRQQIIDSLGAERPRIYFGVNDGHEGSLNIALVWDLGTNRFAGFTRTKAVASPGRIGDQTLLLTPIINPEREDGSQFTNSALVTAEMFGYECNEAYGGRLKRSRSGLPDLNSRYQPSYSPQRDQVATSLLAAHGLTLHGAFGSQENAYADYEHVPLNSELITYAKSQSLYTQFHGELK